MYERGSDFLKTNKIQLAFGSMVFLISIISITQFNRFVPEPYADETVHFKQVKYYWDGRFEEFHYKLTTPPGSHLIQCGLLRIAYSIFKYVPWMFSFDFQFLADDFCTVTATRFANAFLLTCVYFAILHILTFSTNQENGPQADNTNGTSNSGSCLQLIGQCLTAANMCFLPVFFFVSSLCYTETASTLTVILSYSFQLRKCYGLSASFGLISCIIRQTNIVWVAFFAYLTVIQTLQNHFNGLADEQTKPDDNYQKSFAGFFKRCFKFFFCVEDGKDLKKCLKVCFFTVRYYILIMICFLIFLILNNGIVLGDRWAHQLRFHFVQYFYCALFMSIFGVINIVYSDKLKQLLNVIISRPLTFVSSMICFGFLIHNFTYVHYYNVVGNEHYTYYVWHYVFGGHFLLKYALAPLYLICFFLLFNSVKSENNVLDELWLFGYLLCVFLVTVPNLLLEFRYFILPYMFWRIHSSVNGPCTSIYRLVTECVYFLIFNVISIYIFLCVPIAGNLGEKIERLMW